MYVRRDDVGLRPPPDSLNEEPKHLQQALYKKPIPSFAASPTALATQ